MSHSNAFTRFNLRYPGYLFICCLLTSCIPSQHSISGLEYPIEQLRTEEQRAEQQCRNDIKNSAIPLQSFTTDGCSFWPDQPWQKCCVEHDIAYWCGGTREQRQQADHKLMQCITDQGFPLIARFMQLGVYIGGHPWLPLPWRWGYGREWPQYYDNP